METLTEGLAVAYTVFEDVQGTKLQCVDDTWDGLCRRIEEAAEYPSKHQCPLIKLGTFGDQRSAARSLRTNANMLTITGVEGDYDGGKVSPEDAAAKLQAAHVEAIVYTTPSHTPEKPRWRVLAPLSQSYRPEEREQFVALLNGALGGILNDESFTQSQSFYFGRVAGVEYNFYRTEGYPLDEPGLVLSPIGRGKASSQNEMDAFSGGVETREPDEEFIRQVVTGEHYHDPLLRLAARYHGRGMKEKDIVHILQGFMKACQDRSTRWQDRYDDIPRVVASAYQKWQKPDEPSVAFHLQTTEDLERRPPIGWRIKGVLPKTGLAAIYGPPGSGKGFFIIDMAMALSSGSNWFDARVRACPVVYCALEGEEGIPQRVRAYRQRYNHSGSNIRYLLQSFNLLKPHQVEALARAIIETGAGDGVTILDTLNRAAPGTDENDSKDMGLIIAAAKDLQTQVGGLVILVHHTGKDTTKGLRGHSSLLAALDCAIEIVRTADRRSWTITKSKDGRDGTAHSFQLEDVHLEDDEDGEPVTSCVVVPEKAAPGKANTVKAPRGGNQKIVLKAIHELLHNDTSFDFEKWPKEAAGSGCIDFEAAVLKVRDRLTCAPDQRTRSTRQAIAGLVDSGLLALRGGWLWAA